MNVYFRFPWQTSYFSGVWATVERWQFKGKKPLGRKMKCLATTIASCFWQKEKQERGSQKAKTFSEMWQEFQVLLMRLADIMQFAGQVRSHRVKLSVACVELLLTVRSLKRAKQYMNCSRSWHSRRILQTVGKRFYFKIFFYSSML